MELKWRGSQRILSRQVGRESQERRVKNTQDTPPVSDFSSTAKTEP